jgi:hypothetical protein
MRRSCQDTFDDMNCRAAVAFCSAEIEGPYYALGLNPFDLTKVVYSICLHRAALTRRR